VFSSRACPRFLGPHRGFSCQRFLSLVERQEPCRCRSGSARVARLAPCPTCLASLPARYALGVGEHGGGWFANRWHTTPPLCLKPHQQLALLSSALSHRPNSQVLSREVPQGSLPAFASGDVAVRRRNRYLLHCRVAFASSLICCPHRHSPSCDVPSLSPGAIRIYPVPLQRRDSLGPLSTPAVWFAHDGAVNTPRAHSQKNRSAY